MKILIAKNNIGEVSGGWKNEAKMKQREERTKEEADKARQGMQQREAHEMY